MSFGGFIPACISDVSPHHCESTACYHCEEEEVESCDPTVHIRLASFTFLNIHGNRACSAFRVKRPTIRTPILGQYCYPPFSGRFSLSVCELALLGHCSSQVTHDFHNLGNFCCFCWCDGNFLWRGGLTASLTITCICHSYSNKNKSFQIILIFGLIIVY